MKIVFVSNYYNHHQDALCRAFDAINPGEFYFIATSEMRQERKQLGYGDWEIPEYVHTAHTGEEDLYVCQELINDADVVVAGSAPESMLRQRIKEGKLIFRYTERPLKKGDRWYLFLPRWIKWHLQNPASKPIYLLAASAYASADYARYGLFKSRTFRWGYFPKAKKYAQLSQKEDDSILWAGRFLDWKHPDDALHLAAKLRDAGFIFALQFIGAGPMEQQLHEMVAELNLQNYVSFLGSMKPEQVREHMEKAGIFLFTSDKQEGWGAVLNESMNSGCAVVVSHAIGSAPYLVEDNVNGMLYHSGDVDMLYEKVKFLLDHPNEQHRFGLRAYETVTQTWNAEIAAERLCRLAASLQNGDRYPDLYETGPCSKAPILKDEWMK